MAVEVDFVTGLDTGGCVPGIFRIGQQLAPQERVDAAVLEQWDLLGVA